MKKLRIFAASASDMATERARVETVKTLLKPLADHLGIVLDVIDWRVVVPHAGRPQQVIFDQLNPTDWDVFIGLLWHRFGTPPGGQHPQTQKEYLSGTEEEFKTAYDLWKQHGKPRITMLPRHYSSRRWRFAAPSSQTEIFQFYLAIWANSKVTAETLLRQRDIIEKRWCSLKN